MPQPLAAPFCSILGLLVGLTWGDSGHSICLVPGSCSTGHRVLEAHPVVAGVGIPSFSRLNSTPVWGSPAPCSLASVCTLGPSSHAVVNRAAGDGGVGWALPKSQVSGPVLTLEGCGVPLLSSLRGAEGGSPGLMFNPRAANPPGIPFPNPKERPGERLREIWGLPSPHTPGRAPGGQQPSRCAGAFLPSQLGLCCGPHLDAGRRAVAASLVPPVARLQRPLPAAGFPRPEPCLSHGGPTGGLQPGAAWPLAGT